MKKKHKIKFGSLNGDHLEVLLTSVSMILAVVAILGGCAYCNQKLGLDDDNIFEEAIEAVIESKTGMSLDLTPNDDP